MYDAMGVRRQAGYHATAINNLVTAFPSEATFGRGGETDSLEAGLVAGGTATRAAAASPFRIVSVPRTRARRRMPTRETRETRHRETTTRCWGA
jgi:ribulose 1,5-bisphosphate carboxylase large subunit-like protein